MNCKPRWSRHEIMDWAKFGAQLLPRSLSIFRSTLVVSSAWHFTSRWFGEVVCSASCTGRAANMLTTKQVRQQL